MNRLSRHEMVVDRWDLSELITRLMAAIETPDDLTQEDINCLLEDAHILLQEIEDDN